LGTSPIHLLKKALKSNMKFLKNQKVS